MEWEDEDEEDDILMVWYCVFKSTCVPGFELVLAGSVVVALDSDVFR
jgi:hypothetical protein